MPEPTRAVHRQGVTIRYTAQGNGPPLLLLHAGLCAGATWSELGYTNVLKHRFRLLIPDLRGHGASHRPRDDASYTSDALVDDLVAILDAEGLDQVHVWGFSFGGLIGLHLAAAVPSRVASLIVGGVPGSIRASMDLMGTAARIVEQGLGGLAPSVDGDAAVLSLRTVILAGDAAAQAARYRAMAVWPAVDPAALTMPVLLYVGERDRFAPAVRDFAATLPAAQLLLIAGMGHLPLWCHPELYLPDILAFLGRQAGTPIRARSHS